MARLGRAGDGASDLRRRDFVGEKGERRRRLVAGLRFKTRPGDGAAIETRRRAGLEPAQTKAVARQSLGEADRRLLPHPPSGDLCLADMNEAAQESAGGDDHRSCAYLSALAGSNPGDVARRIDQLHPGRFQPRKNFDEASLASLVESVIAQGILQPLLVRPSPDKPGSFEILAGERRWRAAQRARLHEVPVVVRELGDREALEIALVENIQRQDLTPLEEATGYQRLIDEFQHTQEALATALGKSRSHLANMLRLLTLPAAVQALLAGGRISAGHARALIMAKDPVALAKRIVAEELSVRETEAPVSYTHLDVYKRQ